MELSTSPGDTTPRQRNCHGAIGCSVADFLELRTLAIVEEWLAEIEKGDESELCSVVVVRSLQERLPVLFSSLSDLLRNGFDPGVCKRTAGQLITSGQRGWEGRGDLCAMLRQIAHLRSLVIWHLIDFDEMNPDYGGAARLFTCVTIHRFFDDIAREAVEQCVGDSQSW